ncbi:MAG: hypothetical protein IJZ34_00465 [Lachnospiraceae bacterium]|nr:hypothetical protein [Lachnospiraceae bacterium]
MDIKLLLIEDDVNDVGLITDAINEFEDVDWMGTEYHFVVEHLPGMGEKEKIRGREYLFYDDHILDEIEQRIQKKANGINLGLLLDVVLTKDELESKDKNFYPEVNMARTIYERFHDKLPIYVLTSVPSFYTHSERIMGADLSEQFIPKEVLLKYKMKSMLEKLKNYYIKWGQNE